MQITIPVQHSISQTHCNKKRLFICEITTTTSQTLQLSFTDKENLWIHFYNELNGETFKKLKEEQGLFVEFSNFAREITELLKKCLEDDKHSNFIVLLSKTDPIESENNWLLNIVEINSFRKLIHLSLPLQRAKDKELTDHLLSVMKNKIEENKALGLKLEELREESSRQLIEIEKIKKSQELKMQQLMDEFVEKSKTENKCLQDAKLKLSEERKSAQSIIKTLKEDKNLLSEKIDELKKKLQTALDEYHSHKASSEEYKKVLEEKIKLINDQHADLLSRANLKFKDLEKEKNVKENEVEDLKAYVSELQIKHKKDIKNLEEKLSKSAEKSKKYIKEIEEQLLTANKEVEKANDIIGKLHRELRVCKSKLAISLTENENLNNVLQKRTKLLAEKEEECKVVQSQKDIINSLDAAIAQKNNDLQALQKLVANLKGLKETKNLKLLREEYYDVACANQVNQISAAMQTFASLEDVTDSEKSLQMPSYLNSVLKKKSRDPQSTCLMGGVVAQDSEVIRQ